MSDKDRFGKKDSQGHNSNENTTSRKESSKKSKNSILVDGSGRENGKSDKPIQGLSPETQKLIESIRNSNSSSSSKKSVPHSMVEDILREAKLKTFRGLDSSNHATKSSREESRKNNSSSSNSNNKMYETGESKKHAKPSSTIAASSNSTGQYDNTLSELDHNCKTLIQHPRQDSGSFMADEWIDDKLKRNKGQQQKTDITKNADVLQTNRSQSRLSLPTRLASLIGITTSESIIADSQKEDTKSDSNSVTSNTIITTQVTDIIENDSSKMNNEDSSGRINDSNNKSSNSSNEQNNAKEGPGITIDTTIGRPTRKEQRYMVRSPASPRLTKKRTVLRRANARLIQAPSPSNNANDYQRSLKSPVKTVEISSELDEINAQFEETLNEMSKRYQDSTVAIAEKSHLLKRNQELLHTLASKEVEVEYLKNELWEAGNKIQNYESDLKDIIEQQEEPLALTHEDLIRIEREMEDQEVLISGYQKENDKLVSEIKSMNERLGASDAEQEKQHNKVHELYSEIEHLKELLYEKETQETVPEGTVKQIEEMKKEIERLKEKEKTYEIKELALKEMNELKKELSDLRDRESEYMIKIDDVEHQLSKARGEIVTVSRERTESLEKMTEEMNMMKYTYESQIEGIKKEAISKEGRESRFRKLQSAIEKIETKYGSNPEITQICTDLRRTNLLLTKRRKSTADVSKFNKETSSPRSPTTKTLKRTTSQSSLGGMSRASTVTRTVSPTPSVLSNISALSGKDDLLDLQEDDLLDISSEEFAEMKVKLMKLEEENKSSHNAERKEKYDQKMREMEELLLELPADSTENSSANIINNPPQPVMASPNLLKELDTKQNIIEELVDKLKRKEEQLEYYQNAYLEKTEECENYVEKINNANQTAVNGGAVVNTGDAIGSSGNTPSLGNCNAIKYINDALPFDKEIGDISSLPITSDIMGLFGDLDDNQEISDIEKLIAQLERTIKERDMQLEAAHQRTTDAESKLLAITREKIQWGSGYDTTVKQLKTQVEHLRELLQMERKESRRANMNEPTSDSDTTKPLSNESKSVPISSNNSNLMPASTAEIQKLRSQIESLTAENITLKAQLATSEAVRQAVHENTLTLLQQSTKNSLAADEDVAGLRKLTVEKEAEISVLKGRCVGLENVLERQRELLTLVVPSLPGNVFHGTKELVNGKTRDITKLVDNDGIDSKVIEGLSETAKQLIRQLQEENVILRQTNIARQQTIIKKVDMVYNAPPQYKPPLAQFSSDVAPATTVQLDALAKQISEIEARFMKREKELQDIIVETKRQGELQLERWKAKWGVLIDKKNSEIRGFRNELEALMRCLGKLDSVNVNGTDDGVI
ncbi:8119_t:CDS:2 [Funneliformis mosseae]|uniref:8119_t:CDS:1 n=1 Tax=Funneliformis mosseae TaxID=27381 RepID=A0A9N9D6F5_FUNMO|nr:8119_t:CDS:2 [Funneliformis mosseae]